MGFPKVSITTTDGNLQRLLESADVGAIVCADATALAPIEVLSADDAATKLASLPKLLAMAQQYYAETGSRGKLWVMSPGNAKTIDAITKATDSTGLRNLQHVAGGEITLIAIASGGTGMTDAKWADAEVTAAQASLKTFVAEMQAANTPVRIFIGAVAKGTTAVEATWKPREWEIPQVGVVIGSTESNGAGACAAVLGRACKYGQGTKIGNGQNGALAIGQLYIGTDKIEDRTDLEEIHDRGVITFHHRPGRSGYFTGVDWMCTDGDYRYLAHGRVIDAAVRLTAQAAVPYLEGDMDMESDGSIDAGYCAEMETLLTNAIVKNIGGEISGAKVSIATDQDIINTSTLAVAVKVQPKGYATWIEVSIGLAITLE